MNSEIDARPTRLRSVLHEDAGGVVEGATRNGQRVALSPTFNSEIGIQRGGRINRGDADRAARPDGHLFLKPATAPSYLDCATRRPAPPSSTSPAPVRPKLVIGSEVFAGLPAPVQIRNQARVHLWYEQKFGVPCRPHRSTEAAIDTYESTTASLGVRVDSGGHWRIYAPYGFADMFNLVVRPNPILAPRHVYQAKVTRWSRQWPSLTVMPWPEQSA